MAIKVKVKIHELLDEYSISLRELSRLTDIGHSSLSNLANQKRSKIHIDHIIRIAEALGIDDIRKIIVLAETEE